MSVLPILFNTDMVQAILGGRKTVTRRIIKPRYRKDEYGFQICRRNTNPDVDWYVEKIDENERSFDNPRYIYPPYEKGDILYVRETWCEYTGGYLYKEWAEGLHQPGAGSLFKWKPSIHMPKEAARIWLKVTDVRVEELQDITEQQAVQEGINVCKAVHAGYTDGREAFATLWNSTIKKQDIEIYGWKANPFVWVIEFERCEKPEEET